MTPVEPLAIAALIARALDAVDLRYVIGGSVAASLVGEPRSTLHIDIMMTSIKRDGSRVRSRPHATWMKSRRSQQRSNDDRSMQFTSTVR